SAKLAERMGFNKSAGAIRSVVNCRDDVLKTLANTPKDKEKTETSFGTGFFVAPKFVITNDHVIKDCKEEIWVKYPGFREEKAYVSGRDVTNDVVLLKTALPNDGVATFATGVKLGEYAYTYGFPLAPILSTSGNFTIGNITALTGMKDDTRFLQTSTPVQPGNSGGPLM